MSGRRIVGYIKRAAVVTEHIFHQKNSNFNKIEKHSYSKCFGDKMDIPTSWRSSYVFNIAFIGT